MGDLEDGPGSQAPNCEQVAGENAPGETDGGQEEVMQVVYQSDQHGSLVCVESTLLNEPAADSARLSDCVELCTESNALAASSGVQQQVSRAASTLPPVAEESTASSNGHQTALAHERPNASVLDGESVNTLNYFDESTGFVTNRAPVEYEPGGLYGVDEQAFPIYSTVNRRQQQFPQAAGQCFEATLGDATSTSFYSNVYSQQQQQQPQAQETSNLGFEPANSECGDQEQEHEHEHEQEQEEAAEINEEISEIISRQKGAVEKGSFRHNFRKKLGLSVSSNENDLNTFRQKFLDESLTETTALSPSEGAKTEDQSKAAAAASNREPDTRHEEEHFENLAKFKRTHSVSFNMHSARSNRLSVDIRNLPSYLTHKRASIVDVARGAMSSLLSSLGGGGSATGSSISERRDSYQANADDLDDDEPIFEEPIAPTLSLGQRVALVRSGGSEFGTVGWIGQLAEVEDDWVVGVIFDNMIGNSDGAFNGVRYFYARENYALFVPLSSLTKTDNYIGRPETGTMLSRMSLKPGQLISIQRSSIRLQHCFLNAPHQRVGHDVRAVSNRLHCQCHNCGPCAHLTKQGRVAAMPHFGAHHLPHRKKNSLAHAAVELLTHHHHHFHEGEEEHHEEKDSQFGDNAAHACNFVRYSCCQQSGVSGHEFSTDCGMVRPELLDNLIHAPKAPHRRPSRPRRARRQNKQQQQQQAALGGVQQQPQLAGGQQLAAIEAAPASEPPEVDGGALVSSSKAQGQQQEVATSDDNESASDTKSRSRGSSVSSMSRSCSEEHSDSLGSAAAQREQRPQLQQPYNYYTYDSSTTYRPASGFSGTVAGSVFNTMDSHISIMDQRRFIYQRESGAFVRPADQWSDDYGSYYSGSEAGQQRAGLANRILRCFGCLKRGGAQAGRSSRPRLRRRRRGSGRSSVSLSGKLKLSAKDKVLEYRRRQSTFVPSTLAKPQEDFASHGIILNARSQDALQAHRSAVAVGANSDYSSCSKSSSCSSLARVHRPGQVEGGQLQTIEHLQADQMVHADYALKGTAELCNRAAAAAAADDNNNSQSQINYGDFSFGNGHDFYMKHEHSRDSALADLAYSSDTFKTDSSCDTLKHLVDQTINELVPQPPPIVSGGEGGGDGAQQALVSPLSTRDGSELCYCGCERTELDGQNNSEQLVEISSPTASTASALAGANQFDTETESVCQAVESLQLEDFEQQQ